MSYGFGKDIFPKDTFGVGIHVKYDLLYLINFLKESKDIDFEQIMYWQMIISVGGTTKECRKRKSVFV